MKINEVHVNFNQCNCIINNSTNEVLNTVKKTLERKFSEFGLDVTVNKIYDSELFVRNYYSYNGYYVIKSGKTGYSSCMKNKENDFPKGIEKFSEFEKLLVDYCSENKIKSNFMNFDGECSKGIYRFGFYESGVPDFFVYKCTGYKITEAFFVEVKNNDKSTLHYSQFMWMIKHTLFPIKLFWLEY